MSILVDIIPSKTYAHRLLICAALSETPCEVQCDFHSDDLDATRRCLQAIREGSGVLDCGESGSTLRFMLPVAAALGISAEFRTSGRLMDRPMSPLSDELASHGCELSPPGVSPLRISGQLKPGTFIMPGNVTSQFVSGLLMALPILKKESRVIVSGRLQSSAYVDCTIDVLEQFGIHIEVEERETGRTYIVPGKQSFRGPAVCLPEGDWSGAANWLLAGAIGKEPVSVRGLNPDSKQADRQIVEILRQFSAKVETEGDVVTCYPSSLTGNKVDISGNPDLAPVIALAGACAAGETRIVNALRLRMKESDRISSICSVLSGLGVHTEELPDEIHIQGCGEELLQGGIFSSENDHRIVMMEAVASLRSDSPIRIEGAEAVNKSYPGFFRVMEEAGLAGNVEWIGE